MNITARFENGIFRPLEAVSSLGAVSLREGTLVAIEVAIDVASEALDSDFFGLWKDRSEIEDSVQYVNQMRTRARD